MWKNRCQIGLFIGGLLVGALVIPSFIPWATRSCARIMPWTWDVHYTAPEGGEIIAKESMWVASRHFLEESGSLQVPLEGFALEMTAEFRVKRAGHYRFIARGGGGMYFWLQDERIISHPFNETYSGSRRDAVRWLEPGSYPVKFYLRQDPGKGTPRFKLTWQYEDWRRKISC